MIHISWFIAIAVHRSSNKQTSCVSIRFGIFSESRQLYNSGRARQTIYANFRHFLLNACVSNKLTECYSFVSVSVVSNLEAIKELPRLLNSIQKEYQVNNQLPKMSPHTTNSHPIQSPTQQHQPPPPSPANHQHQHHHHHQQQTQQPPQSQPPPPHQQAINNIPSHAIQTHVYQQHQQPIAIPQNYIPHSSQLAGGQMYQMVPGVGVPNVYFSNFTANVNVHHGMQPSYISPNAAPFIPADSQPNAVEQVSFASIPFRY